MADTIDKAIAKDMLVAKCKKCGELINLRDTTYVNNLLAKVNGQREHIKFMNLKVSLMQRMKHGQIQAMRKAFRRFHDLMTEKQREKAKEINKYIRDEFRMVQKEIFNEKHL